MKSTSISLGEMHILENLSCAILAGGKSSRFGSYKALALFKGKPLILHVISKIRHLSKEILISVSSDKQKAVIDKLLEGEQNIRVLIDFKEGLHSPLVGLYTCLASCSNDLMFVIACDMPYVSPVAITILYKEIVARESDAIVPRWDNGMIEPLYAIYRREESLGATERALEKGRLDVRAMLEELADICYFPISELFRRGVNPMTFYNINYLEDLERLS